MINRLGYYIKEGFLSIFTHGLMSFATVGIIVACLLIMGSFTLLVYNVNVNIELLEDDNNILAFIDESYTEAEARNLQKTIESVPNVKSAEFVTNREAMKSFFSRFDDQSQFEGFTASDFRHRFVIKLDDNSKMAETQERVAAVTGIAKVNAHLELAEGFVIARNIILIVSLAITAVLAVVSLFIMFNTVKLTTFERREEIAIMKMVGATSGFIRGPFIFEGLILGLVGALVAFIAQWGIYSLLMTNIVAMSGVLFINIVPFGTVAFVLLGAFCITGFIIGVFGSSMAIKKFLAV